MLEWFEEGRAMSAFEISWSFVKARLPNEKEMYEKGICPTCRGTGEITTTIPTFMTNQKAMSLDEIMDVLANGKESYPYKKREQKAQGNTILLKKCPSCNGSGKPNESEWGIDGIHELNDSWQGLSNWRGEP